MKYAILIVIVGLSILFTDCNSKKNQNLATIQNPAFIHRTVKKLTDVIVHDIFSPPVASRVYAYTMIAGYEALVPAFPQYQSLAGQLKDLKEIPQPEQGKEYCFPLASVHAILTSAKANFIFSPEKIEDFENQIYDEFKQLGISDEVYANSLLYGTKVAEHIVAWSRTDNYRESRTFPKYEIRDELARWKPTPPEYKTAIEPHWNKIRSMTLDSASQFMPPRPPAFDTTRNSLFFKEVIEVYEVKKNLTKDQIEIAQFWDNNPFVMNLVGHASFAAKQISPGGHWIGISKIACDKKQADIMQVMETYTFIAITMFDGFISCWDEKYRSNLVRPETLINKFIDKEWTPLLQTPPFPEYTSGHSVVSSAISVCLTSLYGENFAFTDSTEVEYGFTVRSYKSFDEAAEEACISRLYGGIHYRSAIDKGKEQGRKVGNWVIERINTKKKKLNN
jgi:hypothetical protein